jgi:hypothetical protein
VIELVLATDMKQHFSILSHFTTVHRLNAAGTLTPTNGSSAAPGPHDGGGGGTSGGNSGGGAHARGAGARLGSGAGGGGGAARGQQQLQQQQQQQHGGGGGGGGSSASGSGARSCVDDEKILLPLDENERLLSLQMALKCADLGHLTGSLTVHKR